MTVRILVGDALAQLRSLDAESVQCCVTSPPYWGLRDYGVAGQLGLESTPDAYVAAMVAVFREVRRVLREDGTLWLNLGDSYASDTKWGGATGGKHAKALHGTGETRRRRTGSSPKAGQENADVADAPHRNGGAGLPDKNMVGIPWRVAFALQGDGWYLRSDVIWHKPNVMPENVGDRPTKAHEYVFLFAKARRYYYDAAAVAEPCGDLPSGNGFAGRQGTAPYQATSGGVGSHERWTPTTGKRNRRTVWTIHTAPYPGAHFATFPPALVEPCVLASSRVGDVVLDPFGGAGTAGLVANRHGRDALLIELNPAYAAMAADRIRNDSPMFAEVSVA